MEQTIDCFEKEIETYEKNKEALLKGFSDKYIIVCGEHITGFFDDKIEAINCAYKMFGNRLFMVKKIEEKDTVVNIPSVFLS